MELIPISTASATRPRAIGNTTTQRIVQPRPLQELDPRHEYSSANPDVRDFIPPQGLIEGPSADFVDPKHGMCLVGSKCSCVLLVHPNNLPLTLGSSKAYSSL
jgi:hypothetical protein